MYAVSYHWWHASFTALMPIRPPCLSSLTSTVCMYVLPLSHGSNPRLPSHGLLETDGVERSSIRDCNGDYQDHEWRCFHWVVAAELPEPSSAMTVDADDAGFRPAACAGVGRSRVSLLYRFLWLLTVLEPGAA